MEYPKKIMSISELTELGFTRCELNCAVHSKNQKFAIKTGGGGKWKIDTTKFEEWRYRK